MTFSKAQVFRVSVGLSILLLALWIYVPRIVFLQSVSAVVTARLSTITAPIPGVVKTVAPAFGTLYARGDQLIELENTTLDRIKLQELFIEENGLDERIRALHQERDNLNAMRADIEQSVKKYRRSVAERLEIEIQRMYSKRDELDASVANAKTEFDLKEHMGKKGYVNMAKVTSARYSWQKSLDAVAQTDQEIVRMIRELHDIKMGIFVHMGGRTEVPYQEQRLDEITFRLDDMESKIRELTARLASTRAARKAEENRVENLTKMTIPMPVKGVVWRTFVQKGAFVDKNQPLVEFADCSKQYMDIALPERHFDKVKPGQSVKIRLVGLDRKLSGVVESVRGGSIDSRTAAFFVGDNGIRRAQEIQVVVRINDKELTETSGNFCHIGRNGTVFFNG